VSNIWEHVNPETFVAVYLENYDKAPVIGKVLEKFESSFIIHYWKGTINKKWTPWLTRKKEPWTDTLPKECIYLAAFQLNDDGKLRPDSRQKIKEFLRKKES
jgi:hypothetical protein